MAIWLAVVLCIICLILGFVFGVYYRKTTDTTALLVIDPVNPEVNGGVYVVWDQDPHEMVRKGKVKDGQIMKMEVAVRDIVHESQQNQGA